MSDDKPKKPRGGKRAGAGRPSKAEELKSNVIFENALKKLFNKRTSDTAKIEFVLQLLKSSRGELFVAEHVFGKPINSVDITNDGGAFNVPIIEFFSTEEKK